MTLSNARQERFSQLVALGASKADAYQLAGYKADRHHAARLATKGHVQQRIAEIQRYGADVAQITVASLIDRADELRELAIEHKQISAGVAAVKEIGILSGLRIDRREVGSPGEFERMNDDELRQFIASETAKLIELPDDES